MLPTFPDNVDMEELLSLYYPAPYFNANNSVANNIALYKLSRYLVKIIRLDSNVC